MSYLVYAWLASIFSAASVVVGKLISRHSIKNPWLFNFLWMGFTTIFVIPVALYNQINWPVNWSSIIAASFFLTLFYILYCFALYRLDVTVFAPLFNIKTAFGVLLGVVLFGEGLTLQQIVLIAMIFFAGFFVSLDEKITLKSFFNSSVLILIFCTLSLALESAFIKTAVAQNGYWTVNLWIVILSLVFAMPTFVFFRQDISKVKLVQIKNIIYLSLIEVAVLLTMNRAFAENISISNVILSMPLSMIMTFVLSYLRPDLLEKHTLKIYLIRFAAATVMIFAAVKLSS